MAQIKLGNTKTKEVLTVTIGDKSYNVPLAGSMAYGELRKLQKNADNPDIVVEFFGKYIPEEVLDNLLVEDINALMQAWSDATQESSGATPGESVRSTNS